MRTVQKHGCLIGSVGSGCDACQLPKLFTQSRTEVGVDIAKLSPGASSIKDRIL
jgi:hypothetical protein